MRLGYWEKASGTALKTHVILRGGTPMCGHPHPGNTSLVEWSEERALPWIECRNCLRIHRSRLRREEFAVCRRLAGKDGHQRDSLL